MKDLQTDPAAARAGFRPTRRGIARGAVACLPLLLAVVPFGVIFGVVAAKVGLDLVQTMAMTATVIAGASQLAALQILADGGPALLAILAGAVVNLRFAMYSASLAVELGRAPLAWRAIGAVALHDQAYALTVSRARARPSEGAEDRMGFFLGVGFTTVFAWTCATLAGATLGGRITEEVDLAFMVPVAFLSIVAPMIRGRANVIAAAVSASVALALHWLPFGLGLMAGAAAGIAAGMAVPGEGAGR
jgi:predicted branched-subunit amino acid permease